MSKLHCTLGWGIESLLRASARRRDGQLLLLQCRRQFKLSKAHTYTHVCEYVCVWLLVIISIITGALACCGFLGNLLARLIMTAA